MTLEFQVLAWDRHKNMAGLNQLMGSQLPPSRLLDLQWEKNVFSWILYHIYICWNFLWLSGSRTHNVTIFHCLNYMNSQKKNFRIHFSNQQFFFVELKNRFLRFCFSRFIESKLTMLSMNSMKIGIPRVSSILLSQCIWNLAL